MKKAFLVAAALCIGAAPGFAQDLRTATAEFINTAGETIGTATLRGARDGVLIEIEVSGLPAGEWLGFHAHETGECDPEDEFRSAGGHFNPGQREHGYFVEGGPHAGDMPNQYVGPDGVIRAHVFNSFVRLGEGEADLLGRSLVIHADADDYESQPTGEAGARLACAVVE
jgi:superoxide dismutase, Cu-Zn family